MRVESLPPPETIPAQPPGWNEAGDIVVLRDADDPAYRTTERRLHVLPPRTSVRITKGSRRRRTAARRTVAFAPPWSLMWVQRAETDRFRPRPPLLLIH